MLKIKDKVYFSGKDVCKLSTVYKTPFFLFSEKALEENYKNFQKSFLSNYKKVRVDFSVKTNNEVQILKILSKLGSCAEIVAGHELFLCLKAGFKPEKITFDGPCKSDEEIEYALSKNIHAFYADSIGEFERLNELARKAKKLVNVGLRINLGIKSILEGPAETFIGKFGVPLEEASAFLPEVNKKYKNLRLMAISTHIGSQIISVEPYLKSCSLMLRLASHLEKNGVRLQEINLGGGFPSQTLFKVTLPKMLLSYLKVTSKQNIPPISEYGKKISQKFAQEIRRYNLPSYTLALQPGRSISSSMGVALSRVKVVKEKWIFLDISTSSLPESLFFAQRKILIANKVNKKNLKKYNVAGRGLNSADNFGINLELPEVEVGDMAVILDAGAYSISRANRFTVLNPPVYLIKKTGKITRIRREENFQDVLGPMEL